MPLLTCVNLDLQTFSSKEEGQRSVGLNLDMVRFEEQTLDASSRA